MHVARSDSCVVHVCTFALHSVAQGCAILSHILMTVVCIQLVHVQHMYLTGKASNYSSYLSYQWQLHVLLIQYLYEPTWHDEWLDIKFWQLKWYTGERKKDKPIAQSSVHYKRTSGKLHAVVWCAPLSSRTVSSNLFLFIRNVVTFTAPDLDKNNEIVKQDTILE